MTALARYERLESTAIWRPAPDAQRRDVILSFGDATLMIRDSADNPLGHWSLAAVERLNPGRRPALFAPDSEATETLEIDDPAMIEAVETIRRALRRGQPRRGRVRASIVVAFVALAVLLGGWWLPGALARYAQAVLPAPKRAEIDLAMIDGLAPYAGRPCESPAANRALAQLAARLVTDPPVARILILPGAGERALLLPGGTLVAGRALVEDYDQPEVLAGHALAASAWAAAHPPLVAIIERAGALTGLALITGGALDAKTAEQVATALLTQESPSPPAEALLSRLAASRLPAAPYAYARDITGETTLPLIEADPYRNRPWPPLLADADWVALQNICGG